MITDEGPAEVLAETGQLLAPGAMPYFSQVLPIAVAPPSAASAAGAVATLGSVTRWQDVAGGIGAIAQRFAHQNTATARNEARDAQWEATGRAPPSSFSHASFVLLPTPCLHNGG